MSFVNKMKSIKLKINMSDKYHYCKIYIKRKDRKITANLFTEYEL